MSVNPEDDIIASVKQKMQEIEDLYTKLYAGVTIEEFTKKFEKFAAFLQTIKDDEQDYLQNVKKRVLEISGDLLIPLEMDEEDRHGKAIGLESNPYAGDLRFAKTKFKPAVKNNDSTPKEAKVEWWSPKDLAREWTQEAVNERVEEINALPTEDQRTKARGEVASIALKNNLNITEKEKFFENFAHPEKLKDMDLFDAIVYEASYIKLDEESFNQCLKKKNKVDDQIIAYARTWGLWINGMDPLKYSERAEEIVYGELHDQTQKFFMERIEVGTFKKGSNPEGDIFESWLNCLTNPHILDALESKDKEKIREKLVRIDNALKEQGVSARLRSGMFSSKYASDFADLIDRFGQFLKGIIGRNRKNLVWHHLHDQVHEKKEKKKGI
jgi:hypothetical protein